jgi:hypothetical protein
VAACTTGGAGFAGKTTAATGVAGACMLVAGTGAVGTEAPTMRRVRALGLTAGVEGALLGGAAVLCAGTGGREAAARLLPNAAWVLEGTRREPAVVTRLGAGGVLVWAIDSAGSTARTRLAAKTL